MARTINRDSDASLEAGRLFSGSTGKRETMMQGATLRDYFAAAALTGILSQGTSHNTIPVRRDTRAETAYAWADAMLAAREKAQESDPTE